MTDPFAKTSGNSWPLNDCWITLALKEILDRQKQTAKILVSSLKHPMGCSIGQGKSPIFGCFNSQAWAVGRGWRGWCWVTTHTIPHEGIFVGGCGLVDVFANLAFGYLFVKRCPLTIVKDALTICSFRYDSFCIFSSWVDILASKLEGWHSVWPLCLACSMICFFMDG